MGPLSEGADLVRSVGLVALPAGRSRELLRSEFSGAARLLSYEDGDILSRRGRERQSGRARGGVS